MLMSVEKQILLEIDNDDIIDIVKNHSNLLRSKLTY